MGNLQSQEDVFGDKLSVCIRSGLSIAMIRTEEEKRAEEIITAVAERTGRKVIFWKSSTGLYGSCNSQPETRDVLIALERISHKEKTVYVFYDLHLFFDNASVSPVLIRRLKDLAFSLSSTGSIILLVSPVSNLPEEIRRYVSKMIELPLPDTEVIERRIISELRKHGYINEDKENQEVIVQSCLGLTLKEIEDILGSIIAREGRVTIDDVSEIIAGKASIVGHSGSLEIIKVKDDIKVGGQKNLFEWINQRAAGFKEEGRKAGLSMPKGILLLGVQGCGKSLTAKAIAKCWGMPLLSLSFSKLYNKWLGDSEKNFHRAIQTAEACSPCVLWADEVEKSVGRSNDGDDKTAGRILGALLTWLQEKSKPVFIIATANDVSNLPAEFLRKGRFDEIFFIDLPNLDERKEIFEIHLKAKGKGPGNFNIEFLAQKSEKYTGAEIEEAINSALYDVFSTKAELTTDAILKTLAKMVPLSVLIREKIEELRAWAAGRARPASENMPEEKGKDRWGIIGT